MLLSTPAASTTPLSTPIRNHLLARLPSVEFDRLRLHLESVSHSINDVLYAADSIIDYVYFPVTSVVSMVASIHGVNKTEVGVTGNEGVVGIPAILGVESMTHHAIVQADGQALRIGTQQLKNEFKFNRSLHMLMLRYASTLFTQMTQTLACNQHHPIEKRLARWLLMMCDRTKSDKLYLTQEFLSWMLGVRRASINLAANNLQNAGLIEYTRGNIAILDQSQLENAACECYGIVKRDFDRYLAS